MGLHIVSYLEFYNLFRKQKPIKIVRKKRTQLTLRVSEITMETRYKDTLCDVISEMLVARMSIIFTSRGLWCDSEFARLFSEMPGIES